MVPVYNCANYLEQTLKTVLAQDPGAEDMQITVVDDVSDDDPEAVIKRLAPGRVEYVRHAQRQGAPNNFNACLRLARGHWVHILHGDDAVRSGFYEVFRDRIRKHPELVAVFCRVVFIDEQGHWRAISDLERSEPGVIPDFLGKQAMWNRVWTPSIVVKRSVYEATGGFDPRLVHCCDWDMWKRVALYGPVWFEPEPLALYRIHSRSDTSRLVSGAKNVADMRKALELSRSYLPLPEAETWIRVGYLKVAEGAIASARQLLENGQGRAALAHLREALKASPRPATAVNSLLTVLAFLARRIVRPAHTFVEKSVGNTAKDRPGSPW